MRTTRSLIPFVALLGVACTGTIDDLPSGSPVGAEPGAGQPGDRPAGATTGPAATAPGAAATAPGAAATACAGAVTVRLPARARRLSQREYLNSVADLLGAAAPALDLPADGVVAGYANNADTSVTLADADKYQLAAQTLAAQAAARLPTLLGCDPASAGEDLCAGQLIDQFGARAFRRPIDAATRARYRALYTTARMKNDFAGAARVVLQAMLQSPLFLYRTEIGVPGPGGAVVLDPYETASALSYLLLGTAPDATLTAAAAAGRLATATDVEAQARRLLAGPRGAQALRDFVGQWLELGGLDNVSKDPKVFPEYKGPIAAALKAEGPDFFEKVVWAGDGKLRTALTATRTVVAPAVAALYGGHAAGTAAAALDLDPAQRAGFLTQPGLMALLAHPDRTSPVFRGRFVARKLFCYALPPPPPDAAMKQMAGPNATERDLSAIRQGDPQCMGCHRMIDPIGFSFEAYDGIGRFRTTDGGAPIDDAGQLRLSSDVDGGYRGATGLAARLASSRDFLDCFARQVDQYALARADACAVPTVRDRFVRSGGDIRELLVAEVTTPDFRERQ